MDEIAFYRQSLLTLGCPEPRQPILSGGKIAFDKKGSIGQELNATYFKCATFLQKNCKSITYEEINQKQQSQKSQ